MNKAKRRVTLADIIYPTYSVMKRLAGIEHDYRAKGYKAGAISRLCGIRPRRLSDFADLMRMPHISQYMRLAEVLGWDISRDVNSYYWHQALSTGDIRRRLARVYVKFPAEVRMWLAINNRVSAMDTCQGWCRLVMFVAGLERDAGYEDALDVEE